MKKSKAIVLLSGGLDSATTLYWARFRKFDCHCLIFNYGQRHSKEIKLAQRLAKKAGCPFSVVTISLPWKGSALLDKKIKVPTHRKLNSSDIPPTYVPARNIIFLSFAVSYAEAIGGRKVFIGANAIDYSGYPDCRPEFFAAYEEVVKTGLKTGVEGKRIAIETPLIDMTKSEIIRLGEKLQVPYKLTWSCYQGGIRPCRVCDSCRLREKGFEDIGSIDPLLI